jgi:predicted phosphohydrolase
MKNPIQVIGDVLILAGDIMLFSEYHKPKYRFFRDFIAENFQYCYWLPGNHEYYHYDIAQKNNPLKENLFDNVFLVNNVTENVENVRFIFSTLWSHIHEEKSWRIEQNMNDFHVIKLNKKRLSVADYNSLHLYSLNFIRKELRNKHEKTVVVSHHVPTFYNYPEEYKNSVLNTAFAVELYDLIEQSAIDYWIYGHTHRNVSPFTIGKTKLLTNQLGYVHYSENKGYKPDAFFCL